MVGGEALDIVAFEQHEIAPLGETVSITVRTGDGDLVVLRMDAELLEQAVPLLIAAASRARERADAGLPATQLPGERVVHLARRLTGFAVHHADDKVALELRLSPTGLPVTFSLPRQWADELAWRILDRPK